MKKLLAVFLALMMVLSVSLMACKKDDNVNDDAEVEDDDEFIVNKNNKDTDTAKADDSENEGADTSNGGAASNVWVNETVTVYVRANGVNVRASASTSATIVGSANMGDSFSSESHNGYFYKITYDGAVAYISADFVTANQNTVLFEDSTTPATGSKITIKSGSTCYLRSDPAAADSTNKGSIDSTKTANGELTIVKINKSGTWAEVRFTGKTLENTEFTGSEVLYCTTSVIAELASSNNSSGNGHG